MPQVDFYILSDRHNRERFLCQLTHKVWQQGHDVHIHTNHKEQASQLNDRMWTYSDISFLPHKLADANIDETPITIGWQENMGGKQDVLINLHQSVPQAAEGFARIVEIVAGDEATKQTARSHYREYREKGYSLETHNID